ncbi:MAG: hypothetical protein RQ899_12915 [Pseudomonadales bacterium]|nr:hypothetical protein [Pseudomonadales bacterium]
MKLVTEFELAAKNKNELYALLREAFNEATNTRPDTEAHSMAAKKIAAIYKALARPSL